MGSTARVARLLRLGRRGKDDDHELVKALKQGDEQAFMLLVERCQPPMLRVARMYVPTAEVAEEVVQEAWVGVLNGVERFEHRSSLKTWIFSILVNTAKTRGQRERRSMPFASAGGASPGEPAVDPDRFLPADDERSPNQWALGPTSWPTPEESLLSGETRAVILEAIDRLPPSQREVITLRDVEGFSSEEACNALGITETNQRVLLHRARSRVRGVIEHYFGAVERTH